jgi:hypothetical protein
MMTFLFYVFSYLVVKNDSYVKIFGDESSFNDVTEAYVFTTVFISYPMHSHDFSYISQGIKLIKYTSTGWVSDGALGLRHFPKCKSW